MKKKFKRDINSIKEITKFIAEFLIQKKLDNGLSFTINLAVEELFTNMVKYNAGNPNDVLIGLAQGSNKLIVTIIDYDVEQFDIRQTEEYDATQTLEERPIGKLGIRLVKQIMDKIDYEYTDRQSKITLIKYLRNNHVQHKNY